MIETLPVLPETLPIESADVLSDLLNRMRVSGCVMFRAQFREPWAIITPDSRQLARVLPFRTEHIIPFHIMAAGACWLTLSEHEPILLQAGDAILLPYGESHGLGGQEAAVPVQIGQLLPLPPWREVLVVEHGGAGDGTCIICGFLQCDALLFQPLLRHLPTLLHISPDVNGADQWLATTIRHTAAEACELRPGSRSMLPRLTELMFAEILRDHVQGMSPDKIGWFAALNDTVVGAALRCLHGAPMAAWSVEALARQIGVSRSVLAERFKHLLEQPPMKYLARWRLQLAAQQLKSTNLPIKTIADHHGYESEAAFSRAFKRYFGTPPAGWRKQQGTGDLPAVRSLGGNLEGQGPSLYRRVRGKLA